MSAEKEINVLRGEPIQVKIGDKEETVLRLSIDDQIGVMDLIMKQVDGEVDNKFVIDRMVKIVSMALKREVAKNDFSSVAQIMAAHNKIWIQNEFDFLLQEVGRVKLRAN